MTSCVFSLFFLVSLISSITVVDPTGLKLRITDRGLDVLKVLGIRILRELVNKPLPDFSAAELFKMKCDIKEAIITELRLEPDDVDLLFLEDSILFKIKKLDFAVKFKKIIKIGNWELHSSIVTITGKNMSSTIKLRLNRNQHGRLNVENLGCEVSDDKVHISDNSKLRYMSYCPRIKQFSQWLITKKVCPAVASNLHAMLESMPMRLAVSQNFITLPNMTIDYSLSDDIAVAPHCLDVPFRGRVCSLEVANDDPIQGCADPVLGETNLMDCLGVAEFFFNSAARFINRYQPFQVKIPKKGRCKALKDFGLFLVGVPNLPEGPALLEFTKTPTISITKKTGLSVNVTGRLQSKVNPAKSILVKCQLNMKVEFKENRLVLVSKKAKFDVEAGRLAKPLVNWVLKWKFEGFLKSFFDKGVQIPLPEGVGLNNSEIKYHDGFLVVGGDLDFTPAVARNALQALGI